MANQYEVLGKAPEPEELKKLSNKHGAFYEPDPLLLSMC